MEEIKDTEYMAEDKAPEVTPDMTPEMAPETEWEPEAAEVVEKKSKDFKTSLHDMLTRKSVGTLVVQIVILVAAIPWAFVMLCGLIFDKLLKIYTLSIPIFIVACILFVLGIVLSIMSFKWYDENNKKA